MFDKSNGGEYLMVNLFVIDGWSLEELVVPFSLMRESRNAVVVVWL